MEVDEYLALVEKLEAEGWTSYENRNHKKWARECPCDKCGKGHGYYGLKPPRQGVTPNYGKRALVFRAFIICIPCNRVQEW